MSFASRLWPAVPLLAAVAMAPAAHAATACPGSTLWKDTIRPAASVRALALGAGCQLDCARQQQDSAEGAEHEARAPLPLAIVTHAEDVADWHAGIFERLRGERFEDDATRYCAVTTPAPARRL